VRVGDKAPRAAAQKLREHFTEGGVSWRTEDLSNLTTVCVVGGGLCAVMHTSAVFLAFEDLCRLSGGEIQRLAWVLRWLGGQVNKRLNSHFINKRDVCFKVLFRTII
jgi:Ni,Fe-hydrogenase III large subunit